MNFLNKRGWLTEAEADKVLIARKETAEEFGENSIRPAYLNKKQVEELLSRQRKKHLFFGEAVVQLGLITEAQLMEYLKEFKKLKSDNPQ